MEEFRKWFKENLADYAADIASHGADCGFPHLTYTRETVELFDRFGEEIWSHAVDQATDMGCKNVAEMIAGFGRADMLETLDSFKNLMVWYAAEEVARSFEDERAEEEEEESEEE